MSVSESVSHKDKVSSKNNICRKKAINIRMVQYLYFLYNFNFLCLSFVLLFKIFLLLIDTGDMVVGAKK